ncbi:MAG: hypothetical protein KDB82_17100 [Planctomycetes bacterium]|nr:hypothetical protein [Planctomycetota bacterium]
MLTRFSLAALSVVLLTGALAAQNYTGYPESRVRMVWGDNHFPDELYPANRVIIRDVRLDGTSGGMKIHGNVITDFEADRVPPGEGLPTGQLSGIRINVELYSYDMVLERDPATNKLIEPKVDPKKEGILVTGQLTTVTVNDTYGRFGLATFDLPPLTKPLAPGLYRLVARVRLKSQDANIQKAFKWCSNMYGSRAETITDPDTMESETIFHEVMADKAIHDEVYSDLMDNIGELKDVSLIWIGAVKQNGNVELISAEQSGPRRPANYMVWSYHMLVVGQLIDYEYQLNNVDAMVDEELEGKLKLEGVSDEQKEKWKKEAVEDKKRIRTLNTELIAQYGGITTKQEREVYTSAVTTRAAVMEQVAEFQEYLTQRYWCLTDGWLLYRGWHTVNAPGYKIWEAITDPEHDNKKGSVARKLALQEAKNAPGGLKAKWDKRKEAWKYYPPEITKLMFDYLHTKEETDTFDAEKFTEEVAKTIEMDSANWAEYRSDFILKYLEETEKILRQVNTTRDYAVQVWPTALAQATAARDDVLALTYSWEYYIRVEVQKEEKDPITETWKREDEAMPTLDLSKYYKRGNTAPGTMKARFDSDVASIKSAIKLGAFVAAYRRAIDQGVEAKDLPGGKPPSAPSDD